MRFSEEFLAELRSRVDIEELVSRYTDVRGRGRSPVALCPFHNEKTPSFVIYRETQSYYCFGCGAGGDAINFIRNIENLDYTEAVRFLCEKAGMNMPDTPIDDTASVIRRRCCEANRAAARFFYSSLNITSGEEAREYLAKRKLTQETITHFGLGYAPDSWDSLIKYMKGNGFTESELISFDLAKSTKNGHTVDSFRNRLMFPIIDLRGNVIGFGGRVLDDSKPKYLNTSDTPVYKKSRELYALNFAKNNNKGRLILCEGYMDVIAMHQAGFTQAVAGLGTSFTPEQAKLLTRYCSEVLLSFDSDEAGIKATQRALSILSSTQVNARVIRLTGGKDPDEIIKNHGIQYMQAIIEGALNNTEYALARAKSSFDTATDDGRVGYINEAIKILAAVKNAVERDVYITRLSSETGVLKAAIESQLTREMKNRTRKENYELFDSAKKLMSSTLTSKNPEARGNLRAVKAEEKLLASFLRNPEFYTALSSGLSPGLFATSLNRRFFTLISDRIVNDQPLDITSFSVSLDEGETEYLSGLISESYKIASTQEECKDCIAVLVSEMEKPTRSEGKMTDESFEDRIKRIRQKKLNG